MADSQAIGPSGDLVVEGYHAAVVVPHASTDIVRTPALLYIGVSGNIAVETMAGEVVLFENVPVGMLGPILVKRVNAENTTATNMLSISS